MRTVLQQINLLPEVIGSMIINTDGGLISHEFPTLFDTQTLQEAGAVIYEHIEVLQMITGGVELLNFRYQSGRIVVRPISCGFLILLCSTAVNMPLLNISLNVAVKRLERALIQHTHTLKAKEVASKLESKHTSTLAPAKISTTAQQKPKRAVAFSI